MSIKFRILFTLALSVLFCICLQIVQAQQGSKRKAGDPLQNLPANIEVLTNFGNVPIFLPTINRWLYGQGLW